MLALLSAHCPNFCDVLVKVILGVMVLFIITCRKEPEEQVVNARSDAGGASPLCRTRARSSRPVHAEAATQPREGPLQTLKIRQSLRNKILQLAGQSLP